jgi:hypothetical protein
MRSIEWLAKALVERRVYHPVTAGTPCTVAAPAAALVPLRGNPGRRHHAIFNKPTEQSQKIPFEERIG